MTAKRRNHLIAPMLTAFVFAAAAQCICLPGATRRADATGMAEMPCCRHQSSRPLPGSAPDCPTCSWSVLQAAQLMPASAPDLSLHIAWLAPSVPSSAWQIQALAPASVQRSRPPPMSTLFDLHCQLSC